MIFPRPIHILAAQRSPIGRFGGAFQEVSVVTLTTEVAQAVLLPCSGLVPDQVIVGQALPAGTGMNLARQLVTKNRCGRQASVTEDGRRSGKDRI